MGGRVRAEAMVRLLENGAVLESKDKNGQTPASWAARNGHKAVVKLLRPHHPVLMLLNHPSHPTT
jgi:ankyrin repeat protein